MPKYRAGLHKEISSIFDGVPMPKDNNAAPSPDAPTPDRAGYVPPKPSAPGLPTVPTPKPQQPEHSSPKADPPKLPKADTTIKTARQVAWRKTWQKVENKLFAPKPGVNAARQKATVVLVPVLFIVLIFVFVRVFSAPSHKPSRPRKPGLTKAVVASGDKIDWQIPALWPRTLRDPMQFGLVTTAQGGTSRLIVKGIVYSDDKPTAVIGTQIVYEGDKVSGATVVKINEDSIEFEMNGKRWTQKVQ